MSTPSQAIPRIFVSHSHADNDYCRAFVNGLRTHGLDVWYDEHNLGWGALRQVIEREMQAREHFIAILSPAAVVSEWVNAEIDAALFLLGKGKLKSLLFVTATQCDVPPLLQRYKRIERPDGSGYAPAQVVSHVLTVVRPAAAHRAARSLTAVQTAPSVEPTPRPSLLPTHDILPERFPPRLANLGFTAHNVNGVEFILPPLCNVPAGIFLMGSDPKQDKQAFHDEQPQHRLTLNAYSIARFPVTVAEYACFVRSGYSAPQRRLLVPIDMWDAQLQRLDHPVTCVSWTDAVAYSTWLTELTGASWRLPTEAEWEKAARGSDGRIFPWGDTFDKSVCNSSESGLRKTMPIGTMPNGAARCGAQDLAGNIWEWTSSIFKHYPYAEHDGRESAESAERRVLRGGSWVNASRNSRGACRLPEKPHAAYDNFGYRLVLAASGS